MRFIAFILLFFSFNSFAYNRSDYGVWADLDKNCKSTRIDILTTQALSISKSSCTNIDGTWKDYYSEKIITNDSIIDIDHVIPLAYADKNGANKSSTTPIYRRILPILREGLSMIGVTGLGLLALLIFLLPLGYVLATAFKLDSQMTR